LRAEKVRDPLRKLPEYRRKNPTRQFHFVTDAAIAAVGTAAVKATRR
jgi:hypothetical protein